VSESEAADLPDAAEDELDEDEDNADLERERPEISPSEDD
jgi:hypothetical protein